MTLTSSALAITLLFSLSFHFSVSFANISLGSTLFASNYLNQSWPSPNSTFSLTFVQKTPTSYIPAITYSGGVPVWTAGKTAVDSSGSFQLHPSGTLRLVSGTGGIIWDSSTESLNVSSACLDDSGNFKLLKNDSVSAWSSFDNPTDTILPSQNFTYGKILRSWYYSFTLLRPGHLTLRWNDSVVYYNEGFKSNLTSPILSLQPNGILSIFDETLSSAAIIAYSSDYAEGSDVLRFLRLESDGNLRIYSSARGTGTVTKRWEAIPDQCQVYGYCGNMGICGYNDSSSDPVCKCPSQHFEMIDGNDSRKGCKRKMEIDSCRRNATMLELQHTKFLTFQPELSSQVFFSGVSACRLNCLVSSSCAASTSLSDGTGLCYLKTPGFVSGYQNPAVPSTSYIKVCGPV